VKSDLSDTQFDHVCMRLAVRAARESVAEDEKLHPKVGVVVARERDILVIGHRGETGPGNHAEFGALEIKSPNEHFAGATVYTTLEPCTDRNHPKIPCAKRLIERRVGRVVIGMVDPDPRIRGNGMLLLQHAGIALGTFDRESTEELLEINRDFIRAKTPVVSSAAPQSTKLGGTEEFDFDFTGTWRGKWQNADGRAGEEVIYVLTSKAGKLIGTFFDKNLPEAPIVFEGTFRKPYLRIQFHSPYPTSEGRGVMEDGSCFLKIQNDDSFSGFYASFSNYGKYELSRA
jgi:pyrimidine deaminase RibD-like protein